MLTFKSVSNAADSALVLDSLGGDKDAFCQIVMRYQTLLCSIAYSAIGDIKLSEDVAQEAFVEAWTAPIESHSFCSIAKANQ